jgi:excisionase family DNA binding protein
MNPEVEVSRSCSCGAENRYWTVEQVAELTGMGIKWLRAQCHDGLIPHHRFGRSYRFTAQDLDRSYEAPEGQSVL